MNLTDAELERKKTEVCCFECMWWGNGVWVNGFKNDPGQLPHVNEELYYTCTYRPTEKVVTDPISGTHLADNCADVRVRNKDNDCKFFKKNPGATLCREQAPFLSMEVIAKCLAKKEYNSFIWDAENGQFVKSEEEEGKDGKGKD